MSKASADSPLAVVCPACQQALRIKGFRAGRYSSRCPHCHVGLRLVIGEPADGAPLIEVMDRPAEVPAVAFPGAAIPETLGGYRLIRKLGEGGMGTVYLARQLSLDRNVALKVLSKEWVEDPRFLIRFVREAHAAARLVHHNIVQIYDIGSEGKHHFFSMEFVQGQSLAERIRSVGRLDVATALDFVIQAAHGLQFAHAHGLVHRDIKPDNLMVNAQGIVKVADLGLVKTSETEEGLMGGAGASADSPSLTRLGTGMGTPAYIAPEQARDATQVDARADIYSLGCTLYVLLTGQPPFQGETAMEVLIKHLSEPPQWPINLKPGIPTDLWAILARMLAKKPVDRFASMDEVVAALEHFRQTRPEARPPGVPGEEEVTLLTRLARQFHQLPLARAVPWVVTCWLTCCAVLLFFATVRGWGTFAACLVVVAPCTLLSRTLITSYFHRTALFTHLRAFLGTRPLRAWLLAIAGTLLVLVLLFFSGLLVPLLGALAVAVVLGGCGHYFVDQVILEQRRDTVEKTQRLLQRLRVRSLGDTEQRRFVAEYAGVHWQEFFETLFGFEALQWARTQQIADASGKPRDFAPTLREQGLLWLARRATPPTQEAGLTPAVEATPAPSSLDPAPPPESQSP